MSVNRKIFFTVFIATLFLIVDPAQAFSINPLKYTVTMDAGEQQILTINVKNDSQENKTFKESVAGIKQDAKGRPIFQNNIDIAESWINLKNESEIIKAGESKNFVFDISVPQNTPPGAHYVGLIIEEENGNVSPRLASILILQVAGVANESVLIEKFYPIKKYFFDKNLVCFLELKNYGNIDVSLKGEMKLLSVNNKLITSVPINLGTKLFAQASRDAQVKVLIPTSVIWPGLYRSQVVVRYGLTNQQIIGNGDFWYFPIWFLIFIFIILSAISFLVLKKNKHEKVF